MHRVVSDYTRIEGVVSNIKVYVRARPLDNPSDASDFLTVDRNDDRKVVIKDPESSNKRYGEVSFQFDKVFWTDAQQNKIFDTTCRQQVDHVINGFNCCCFAYGQTGSGKTYTMFGGDDEIRGIIPRSVEYLFQCLGKKTATSEVAMVCSFLEIYNDQIRDLGKAYLVAMGVESSSSAALYEKTSNIFENLAGKRGNPYFAPAFHRAGSVKAMDGASKPGMKEVQDEYNTMNYEIREDNEGNVFVKDLSLVPVTTLEEVLSMISMGLRVRATHETKMNTVSSRSHTVFTVTVLQKDKITGESITGMLNLVDLAGSERLKKSESQGVRLKEALHINSSLTALGKVIMALDPSSDSSHVPYRDSKLTRVLQNSLGGNSYTSVIATIHPMPSFYDECLSSLQFANRCRNVQNNPRINYVEDNEDKDKRIRKLLDELNNLRTKLAQQGSQDGHGGSGGGNEFSMTKLVEILKKVGIQADVSSDGAVIVNGKRIAKNDLGLGDEEGVEGGKSGRFNSSSFNGPTVEKLQKAIKDLKENNIHYLSKAKERKVLMEEQGREIQRLSSEVVKLQTALRHKEFECNSMIEEKERSLKELKLTMDYKHKEELDNLVQSNQMILKESQKEVEKIPIALQQYTQLINRASKMKFIKESPIRAEFEVHLDKLEKSRVQELSHVKQQYEHFLVEKDKALSGFVDSFNTYRKKKSEQLRLAEREIVNLFEYTEKLEKILDNVEKGTYRIQTKQKGEYGRTSTGRQRPLSATATSGISDSPGAVLLPKGLRPQNPLKNTSSLHGKTFELTKKIVEKHKERVSKLEKMKEDAFQKSLQYAAQVGATATGSIDDLLQSKVHNLLVDKTGYVSTNKPKFVSNVHPVHPPNHNVVTGGASKLPKVPPGFNNRSMSSSSGLSPPSSRGRILSQQIEESEEELLMENDQEFVKRGQHLSTLPEESDGSFPVEGPKSWQSGPAFFAQPVNSLSKNGSKEAFAEINAEVLMELEELRAKSREDQVTLERVTQELQSNETFRYIQKLETELNELKDQLRETNRQLQSSKVANASLSRKMGKTTMIFDTR